MSWINTDKAKEVGKRAAWAATMGLIAILFLLSIQHKRNADVAAIHVIIKPIKGNKNLISAKEVETTFRKYLGYDITKANIKEVPAAELEELLRADKRIKKVEIFIDGNNKLNVWIVQKQPIVRVMDGESFSYYLDEEGGQIPVQPGIAIRVPVATGYIDLYNAKTFEINENAEKTSMLKEVYEVALKINDDQFLSALIEQIDVNEYKEISLIPKIGRQRVKIGDAENLDEKVFNLKLMYKDGLPRIGWNKYAELDLKYRGQVVGRK